MNRVERLTCTPVDEGGYIFCVGRYRYPISKILYGVEVSRQEAMMHMELVNRSYSVAKAGKQGPRGGRGRVVTNIMPTARWYIGKYDRFWIIVDPWEFVPAIDNVGVP